MFNSLKKLNLESSEFGQFLVTKASLVILC